MKIFQVVIVVLLMFFVGDSHGRICVGNSCTDSNSVGPIDIRQHNGYTQCSGPGCADLGVSSRRFLPQQPFMKAMPSPSYSFETPIIRVEEKCSASDKRAYLSVSICHYEIWYHINDADILSAVSEQSGCMEHEIISAIKKAHPGQQEILLCTK